MTYRKTTASAPGIPERAYYYTKIYSHINWELRGNQSRPARTAKTGLGRTKRMTTITCFTKKVKAFSPLYISPPYGGENYIKEDSYEKETVFNLQSATQFLYT
jgi:hypothetical protein